MPVSADLQSHHPGIDAQQLDVSFKVLENELSVPRFTEYQAQPVKEPAVRATGVVSAGQPRKGRLFVGFILAMVCFIASYTLWDAFFRYSAHGIVEGHVVEVIPAWAGAVQSVHVREGDRVEIGQLLLTLENPDLRQKVARADEELRLARATLAAESARLEWQGGLDADRQQQASAEYHQAWGNLLNEQAQLELAKRRLERATQLAARNLITADDLESAIHVESGQRQKVAQLETAVAELRQRADAVPQVTSLKQQQLEPHLFRIAALQAEIVRCNEELARGEIRAPVCGVVIKCECLPGDYARLQSSVLSLLEEGSDEIVLYLRQAERRSLDLGDLLHVQVLPRSERIPCQVVRIGQELLPAPKSIERYYRSNEHLLQVYLRPETKSLASGDLRLGAVADVLRSWWLTFSTMRKNQVKS